MEPRTLLALAIALGFAAASLGAATALARNDAIPGSRYQSGRASALGDAYITLVDDGASAMGYNPAGLARLKKARLELVNMNLQGNMDYLKAFKSNSFYKVTDLEKFKATLQEKKKKNAGVSAQVFPTFSFKSFGVGILYTNSLMARYESNQVRYRPRYEFVPTAGVGLRLAQGIIRLGYVFQYVNKATGDVTKSVGETLSYKDGLSQGAGMSHNIGAQLTLPLTYLPALAVVVRNLGGVKYSGKPLFSLAKNASGSLATEPMSIDASYGMVLRLGKLAHTNWLLEARDVTGAAGMSWLKRIALGFELSFRDVLYLRGGYGSGYPSGGLGIRRKRAQFSLTYFSEDIGNSSESEKDTRFAFHYQVAVF